MRRLPLSNPARRFETSLLEYFDGAVPTAPLRLYEDETRTALSKNDSPDVGFRVSLNPYRGCLHGCAYCYARPTHEYLGFGSGTDFERRIVVKRRVAELLRQELAAPAWTGERIVLSGNTDPYQPIEATFGLTRSCLGVLREFENPVHVVTKSPLVERDIDRLRSLAEVADVGVSVSIPVWDEAAARAMEPYAATPRRRIETIRRLSSEGIAVTVNVAPLIPGLGDREMPHILSEARAAGARSAAIIILRLPGPVREVFESRLRSALPLVAGRVMELTRQVRGGRENDARFFSRMRGEGPIAEAIHGLFESTARRLGLDTKPRGLDAARRGTAGRATDRGGQLLLFDSE